jgi:hypothetical protein
MLAPTIGAVLPLALGIAISPIPVIAAILMLLSPKAKATSVGFLIGWVLGILVIASAFTLLSSQIPSDRADASMPLAGFADLMLGVLLLLLAARQWRRRPKAGAEPVMPKWMAAIDTMNIGGGFMLGILLSGVNPKNLLMGIGAGVAIGDADIAPGSIIAVTVIYTTVAAATVTGPVVAYLVASTRVQHGLDELKVWLLQNNSTVMCVLLLVIGVVMIGKGLASF